LTFRNLNRWVTHGTPPPRLPGIAVLGSPPIIQRDPFGNALGGIRLAEMVILTASYGGINTPGLACFLAGFTIPFDKPTLASLNPNNATYVSEFIHATVHAVEAGFMQLPDAREAITLATQTPVP
jgi:hypothetical protein